MSFSKKYFTSLKIRTSAGSKFTKSMFSLSLANKDYFSLSFTELSTSFSHSQIFKNSYSQRDFIKLECSFCTSLYSSRSVTAQFKFDSFSMGSFILSISPRAQFNAPVMGGWFLAMGAFSSSLSTSGLPSKNMCCTVFRSNLQLSSKVMCFFSSSS